MSDTPSPTAPEICNASWDCTRCELPAGHDGNHATIDEEVRWIDGAYGSKPHVALIDAPSKERA